MEELLSKTLNELLPDVLAGVVDAKMADKLTKIEETL